MLRIKVDNDTVYFDSFPIKDIVLDIVGDEETANKMAEALGDGTKIGYEPELNTEKDEGILFVLDCRSLWN